MRGVIRTAGSILLLLTLALPAPAQDPYATFRIPEYHRFSWNVSGNGSWSGRFGSDSVIEERARQVSAGLRSTLAWTSESEAQSTNLTLQPSELMQQFRQVFDGTGRFSSLGSHSTSETRFGAQQLFLFASRYQYRPGSAVFAGAQLSSQLGFTQFIRDQYQRVEDFSPTVFLQSNHDANLDHRASANLELRAGVGRIRDVTGVYAADLVERRLRATGRLERELSAGTRRQLAELFYTQNAFGSAHERSNKYFWREVERVLREDGALKDGVLDTYSVLRILEPAMNRFSSARTRGFSLAAVTAVQLERGHRDTDFRNELVTMSLGVVTSVGRSERSNRVLLKESVPLLGLSADYGMPLGERWQWAANTSVRYGVDPSRLWSLNTNASLVWLVADRWFVDNALFHQLESRRIGGTRLEPNWLTVARSSVGYWIEDAWAIEVQADSQQRTTRSFQSIATTATHNRDHRVQIALTYLPKGRFDAPGLGLSQHLTPGMH